MTIDANDRKLLTIEVANDLRAASWTLRCERAKFSVHILRVTSMKHVYDTLAEIAESLDIAIVTLMDIIFVEGIEMDKNTLQQQAVEEAQAETDEKVGVNSTNATSSKGEEATKPTEPARATPESSGQEITEDQQKQYARLVEELTATIGMRNLVAQLDRIEKTCKGMQVQLDLLQLLFTTTERIEQKFTGFGAAMERIDQKFTGIGKALDVIAQAVQKNMAAGNNGGDPEQGG